jgi:hypothetical protein
MSKILQGLRWFFTRVPFAPLLVLVLFLQIVEEFYPFSQFPMYQRFDEQATYLFVTNGKDEIIPVQKHFSYGTSRVKKSFKNSLRDEAKKHGRKLETATEEDMKAAGADVLKDLYKLALKKDARKLKSIQGDEIKLWHGLITLENDKFSDKQVELASLKLDRAKIDEEAAKKGDAPVEEAPQEKEKAGAGEDEE